MEDIVSEYQPRLELAKIQRKVVLTYYVPKEKIASEVVEQEILFLFHPCV